MLRGFYTAASGMIAQQRQQESLANNIANQNTPGYKADHAALRAFPELLLNEMGSKNVPTTEGLNIPIKQPIGALNTGVYIQETIPNFLQGDLKETGVTTDLALVHNFLPEDTATLLFTVQNEDGDERYTRNGNFTVDGQGFLATNEGYYVLDQTGDRIPTSGMEFDVTSDGMLQVGGQNIPIGVAYIEDANELVKEGNGLYNGDVALVPAGATFTVEQGFLEQSNVDSLQMMTQMTESYRMFETNQRVLKAYDESMGKAVNEIGRLR